MSTLDDQIKSAEQHVQDGRRIVAQQRERIASGKSFNEAKALELLHTFERTLAILEADLARLLADRDSN
ncbi:hypothetical protein [Bradyrhizobium sp. th.b2]|uniref:hypothetical protein n=1 Tax=Bradyrhizobium sp. th-b2 TaxID=172088 RepID=UPI00048EAA1C|nr:hypothetical protein [Bradyrhizobium sp. th.b2]